MRRTLQPGTLFVLLITVQSCDDCDVTQSGGVDRSEEYTVTTTVVSNTCTEQTTCAPICRLWWLGIDEETQPLRVGPYGNDLVVCPLGPLNGSRIVNGVYAEGIFDYDSNQRYIISSPDPGCILEMRWSSTLLFSDHGFSGEAVYELVHTEGDPDICSASSAHFTTLPCETVYQIDATRCVGCTPQECAVS